jgi:hypothetical protein
MRAAAVLLVLVGAALFAAPVPKVKKQPTLEEKLLGKWRLVANRGVKVPNSTFHMVFLKDGKLEFHYAQPGGVPQNVSTGTVVYGEPTAESKFGSIDWAVGQGGQVRAELDHFTELTDDEFELVDPAGITQRYERVKEQK